MNPLLFALARPALHLMDAETAHRASVMALRFAPPMAAPENDPRLAVQAFGLAFPNPLGLAAGFDKHAEVPDKLLATGFGFVEVGAVTPRPQPGNPRPRTFRLTADEAVINRYGFNSEGLDAVAPRLEARARRGIVGVNLGSNKETVDRAADYEVLVRRLARCCDFLTANISSPNTPGLRAMQGREQLDDLLARVIAARDETCAGGRRTPVLVKIAPDVTDTDIDDIVAVARARGVDGMIVSNTTVSRPPWLKETALAKEAGGLSGKPLFRLATQVLAKTAQRVESAFPLIGVGGIDSGETALIKLAAGATLLQLYSALVFQGPALIAGVKHALVSAIHARGATDVSALVGTDIERIARGDF